MFRLLLFAVATGLFLCFPSFAAINFEDKLGTNQYLLIGIADCELTIEVAVPERTCSHHMTGIVRYFLRSYMSVMAY